MHTVRSAHAAAFCTKSAVLRGQAASQLEARLTSHVAAEGGSGQGAIAVGAPVEDVGQGEGAPLETVPAAELRAMANGMRELVRLKDAGNRWVPALPGSYWNHQALESLTKPRVALSSKGVAWF